MKKTHTNIHCPEVSRHKDNSRGFLERGKTIGHVQINEKSIQFPQQQHWDSKTTNYLKDNAWKILNESYFQPRILHPPKSEHANEIKRSCYIVSKTFYVHSFEKLL